MTESTTRPRWGRSTNRAVSVGREVIQLYGMATATFRPNPEFLIIGAKRGGSTSFYFDLLQHSHVCPLFPRPDHLPKAESTKGIHFFDQNFDRGERWYRGHLPSGFVRHRLTGQVGAPIVTGEASPYYLFHPAAARRAAGMLPEVKVIAVLRDPVMRAYSHWKERRRNNREDLTFAAALEVEDRRIGNAEARLTADPAAYSYAHEQQSYARQSEYAPALQRWYKALPAKQILVLSSEEYYANPEITLSHAQEFLGLPLESLSSCEVRNAAPGEQLDPLVRERLMRRFAPHNEQLVQLTGRTFPWS